MLAAAAGLLCAACKSGGDGTTAPTHTPTPTPTPTVVSVSVSPASQSITVGAAVQLTAAPEEANGTTVTGQTVAWSSASPAIASVSASGMVSGVAPGGPVLIYAVVRGVTGVASVTVSAVPVPPAPVAQVTVAPASATIVAGTTVQLAATTKSATGAVLTGRTVTWTSGNAALATVSATGLVTGVAAGGPVTITATSEGINGTASVTITSATVYDPVNNITWIADANLPASNRFGVPVCTGTGNQACVNPNGSMKYDAATAWVAAMNAANYLGHANWQLPTSPPIDNNCGRKGPNGNSFGYGCTADALATLYNGLGFKSPNTVVPIPGAATGPFSNIQPYLYWSTSAVPPNGGNATFAFATGWQGANTLPNFLYAWPMIAGKLGGTPAANGNGLQVNPGGQTVYDPLTNITWLANANLAASNAFGLPPCTDPLTPVLCVAADGAMTYTSASQWIANMNAASYLGQANWQLPAIDGSCPGYNCGGTLNPMGNLFYTQLGFTKGMTVPVPDISVGGFHNFQPYLYWSCGGATIQSACEVAPPAPNFEWSYSFGSGFEGTDLLANSLYVMVYFVGR